MVQYSNHDTFNPRVPSEFGPGDDRKLKVGRRKRPPLLYVDQIKARGREFFEKVCELDLEGIVAKRKSAAYRATEKPSPYWIKIKNPNYSLKVGRNFSKAFGIELRQQEQ
jgi:hypothetical protein